MTAGTTESTVLPVVARIAVIPAAGDVGPLDYAIPDDLRSTLALGTRVVIPLGPRRVIGIVVELLQTSQQPKLKPLIAALDREPLIDRELLQLCGWLADYYLCNLSEALSTALPGSLRVEVERIVHVVPRADAESRSKLPAAEQTFLTFLETQGSQAVSALAQRFGASTQRRLASLRRGGWLQIEERLQGAAGPTKVERHYKLGRALSVTEAAELKRRRPAQYAIFAYLHQHPLHRARSLELFTTFPNAGSRLRALIDDGLVVVEEEEIYRTVLPEVVGEDRIVELTPEQSVAVGEVVGGLDTFAAFLLWGVTGSGKTEVYLRCIAAALDAGRTALALVPEISLTHQLVDRIRMRFGQRVAVLHSSLSDGERWDEWRKIARGEAPIVVGARSAVFAPLPRLGLIIADEEHDQAYKQEDGIRYNARDVAVMRANRTGCPVILGSATPSMETFHNARSGRYRLLTLSQRVEQRPLPSVDVVDLRRGSSLGKALLISTQLTAALKTNFAVGGQSLVFLNRRGFANFLQCHQCGETLMCPNCSVSLTLHRRWQALRCHHCDFTIAIPNVCASCGGQSLGAWGAGTEQVETILTKLLQGARVGRLDRDTTSRKGALRRLITAWEKQEFDVLIGTQMVTKGHDVPGVTLVGVLLADLSLNLPDLRAAERTFQLLTQVAGRAGRGSKPGRVIVQTLQPQHYSLRHAAQHDFRAFAEEELAARRESNYPPFMRLVQIRCEGESAEATERLSRSLAAHIRQHAAKGVAVLGPTPSPIERLRRRFRWQMLLRGNNGAALRQAARAAREAMRRQASDAEVRVLVDVDPYSML
ncbi:MAG TPA: primosomal protein N' [Candidatus Acidoferrales bacterium]|nr:primosomal protein N' [Candidatus Acidoferrales bacterium]